MLDRDLCEAFQIDPNATAIVRKYRAGEFPAEMLKHWCRRMLEVNLSLPEGWRSRIAIKVVEDIHGNEHRFPVMLVENENLP